MNPSGSSAESTLRAGRGPLSDSPLCSYRKFVGPPLEGLCGGQVPHEGAGVRPESPSPVTLGRSEMHTQTQKSQ